MKKNCISIITALFLASTSITAFAGEWIKTDDGNLHYQKENGVISTGQWENVFNEADGVYDTFYFDEYGNLVLSGREPQKNQGSKQLEMRNFFQIVDDKPCLVNWYHETLDLGNGYKIYQDNRISAKFICNNENYMFVRDMRDAFKVGNNGHIQYRYRFKSPVSGTFFGKLYVLTRNEKPYNYYKYSTKEELENYFMERISGQDWIKNNSRNVVSIEDVNDGRPISKKYTLNNGEVIYASLIAYNEEVSITALCKVGDPAFRDYESVILDLYNSLRPSPLFKTISLEK